MEEHSRINTFSAANIVPQGPSEINVANHNVTPEENTKKLREELEKLPLDHEVHCEDSTYDCHDIAFQLSSTEAGVTEEDLAMRNLTTKFNNEVTNPEIVKDLVHKLKDEVANDITKQRVQVKHPDVADVHIKIHPHIRNLCAKLIKDLSQQVEQAPEVLINGDLRFSNKKNLANAFNRFKVDLSHILSVDADDPQISTAITACRNKIIHEFKYHKSKLINALTLGLSQPLLDYKLTQTCYNEIDTLCTAFIKKRFEELIEESKNSYEVLSKLKEELRHGIAIKSETIEELSKKHSVAPASIKDFLLACEDKIKSNIDTALSTQTDELAKEKKKYSDKLERHLNKLRYNVLDMPTLIKDAVSNHLKQSVFNSDRNIHWHSSSKQDSLKSEILNLKIKLTDKVKNDEEPSDKTLRELGFDVNLSKLNFDNPNSFSLEFTLPDLDQVSSSNNLFKTERETVFAFKIDLTPELGGRLNAEDVIERFVDDSGNSVSGKTGWRIQPQKARDYEASTADIGTQSIDNRTLNIEESSELATSKKMQPRTRKNVGRRIYEAFLLSINVSPDSNDGFFRNILNIFTQIPKSTYIATFVAAGLTAGLLALSGVIGYIALTIIAFGIPLIVLPTVLWLTRLFTNLSVGLIKNMTDVSLIENQSKEDLASAIISGFFCFFVVTPIALALNIGQSVVYFKNNDFTTARIDGTEKLIREIRLLRALEAITGLAVVAVYTALGIVAGLAITLSNAGALGFIAAAASPGLMTWMSPIIILMASSPATLTLILTFSAIATAVLGSKILYDLVVMFIVPIVSKYRSDKKLETASELAARLINGTNSRPPYLGLIGEEIFLPLIELLQNEYRDYENLAIDKKELLILQHAVGANYILDQYRTLLELKKVIQQARAENPENTIAEIIAQLNYSSDVHIGLYLQSMCPDAKDRKDPQILDLIENNLNRSIGMLMPFVSVKSQIIKEAGQEERLLKSSEYRATVKQAKSVEEFYSYVEMPKEHIRFLRAILKNPDELAEELKSMSPRQYRLLQKIRYGQWASDLFDREREEKTLFLNYVTVVEGGDVEQSISKKIKLYLPGESNRLLEKFDREKIYDPKIVKELRAKRPHIKSVDGLIDDLRENNRHQEATELENDQPLAGAPMQTKFITKELVDFVDNEYKERSAELQDLQKKLKDKEIEILSRKKMLQRLLSHNGNTVNSKIIIVERQIDKMEQEFAILLYQASICEKIIHYDENLLRRCATQTINEIDVPSKIPGIEGFRQQYDKMHENLEKVDLNGHFLRPIISHTSMLDESYKFIESRTTAISENTELMLATYQECSVHRIHKNGLLNKNHEADQIKMRILKESEEQMLIKLERAKNTIDYLKNYCERHDTIDATTAQTILARYRDLLPLEADMSELLSDMLYGANVNKGLTLLIGSINHIQSLSEEDYTQALEPLLANDTVANFILALEHHINDDKSDSKEIQSLVSAFKKVKVTDPIDIQKTKMEEIRAIATRMVDRATVNDILTIQATLALTKPDFKTDIVGDIKHIAEKVDLLIDGLRFDKKCLEAAMPVHDSKNFEPEVKCHNPNLDIYKSRAQIASRKLSNIRLENRASETQSEYHKLNEDQSSVGQFINNNQQGQNYHQEFNQECQLRPAPTNLQMLENPVTEPITPLNIMKVEFVLAQHVNAALLAGVKFSELSATLPTYAELSKAETYKISPINQELPEVEIDEDIAADHKELFTLGDSHAAYGYLLFTLLMKGLKKDVSMDIIGHFIANESELNALGRIMREECELPLGIGDNSWKHITTMDYNENDQQIVKGIFDKITDLAKHNREQFTKIFDLKALQGYLSLGDNLFDRKMAPELVEAYLDLMIALMENDFIMPQILGNHDTMAIERCYFVIEPKDMDPVLLGLDKDREAYRYVNQEFLHPKFARKLSDDAGFRTRILNKQRRYIELCTFVKKLPNGVMLSHAGLLKPEVNKSNSYARYINKEFKLDEPRSLEEMNNALKQELLEDWNDVSKKYSFSGEFTEQRLCSKQDQYQKNRKICQIHGHDGTRRVKLKSPFFYINLNKDKSVQPQNMTTGNNTHSSSIRLIY